MEEEWLKIKIESCTAPPEHDHGLAFARALPEFRHRWVDLQLTCGDGAVVQCHRLVVATMSSTIGQLLTRTDSSLDEFMLTTQGAQSTDNARSTVSSSDRQGRTSPAPTMSNIDLSEVPHLMNVSGAVLEQAVNWMYTHQCRAANISELVHLFAASKALKVTSLADAVLKALGDLLATTNGRTSLATSVCDEAKRMGCVHEVWGAAFPYLSDTIAKHRHPLTSRPIWNDVSQLPDNTPGTRPQATGDTAVEPAAVKENDSSILHKASKGVHSLAEQWGYPLKTTTLRQESFWESAIRRSRMAADAASRANADRREEEAEQMRQLLRNRRERELAYQSELERLLPLTQCSLESEGVDGKGSGGLGDMDASRCSVRARYRPGGIDRGGKGEAGACGQQGEGETEGLRALAQGHPENTDSACACMCAHDGLREVATVHACNNAWVGTPSINSRDAPEAQVVAQVTGTAGQDPTGRSRGTGTRKQRVGCDGRVGSSVLGSWEWCDGAVVDARTARLQSAQGKHRHQTQEHLGARRQGVSMDVSSKPKVTSKSSSTRCSSKRRVKS